MIKDHDTDRYLLHAQIGDLVCDVADERQIGRVESIHWPACRATVRWLETNTLSELPMTDLKKTGVAADETPATFADLKPPGYWSNELGYFVPVRIVSEEEFWESQPRGVRRRHGKLKD